MPEEPTPEPAPGLVQEDARLQLELREIEGNIEATKNEISTLESYVKNVEVSTQELQKYIGTLQQFRSGLSCRSCGAQIP